MRYFEGLSVESLTDQGYEVPGFVKEASDREAVLFAYNDGINTRFPIDTPGNTWMSLIQFEKCANEIPVKDRESVATMLKEAAEFHNIGEIKQTIVKTACESEEFTKYASEVIHFEDHYASRKPTARRSIAKELLERRKHLMEVSGKEVPLSRIVERYAGDDLAPDWKDHLHSRIRLVAHKPEARREYEDVLNSDEEIERHEHPEEVAEVLEHLDRKHGLDSHWDHTVKDPVWSTMANHPRKPLRIIVMRVDGRHFMPEHLADLKREFLDEKLDSDIVDEIFNKRNESLEHMPDFVKHIIAGLVSHA